MAADALPVLLSLVILGLAALLLGLAEFQRYRRSALRPHLYWSLGLGLVAVTIFEEAAFVNGLWSAGLVQSYLFLIAFLVGLLSLGSAEAGLTGAWKNAYFGYVAVVSAATLAFCLLEPVGPGILSGGIVTGSPPLGILVASSALTVPAAVLMVVSSLMQARRQRRWRLAWIALGIIVISIAGGLYIASIPETLYYAEFVGVVLLFLGFGGVRGLSAGYPEATSA